MSKAQLLTDKMSDLFHPYCGFMVVLFPPAFFFTKLTSLYFQLHSSMQIESAITIFI